MTDRGLYCFSGSCATFTDSCSARAKFHVVFPIRLSQDAKQVFGWISYRSIDSESRPGGKARMEDEEESGGLRVRVDIIGHARIR